jgi:hypothetical protein
MGLRDGIHATLREQVLDKLPLPSQAQRRESWLPDGRRIREELLKKNSLEERFLGQFTETQLFALHLQEHLG